MRWRVRRRAGVSQGQKLALRGPRRVRPQAIWEASARRLVGRVDVRRDLGSELPEIVEKRRMVVAEAFGRGLALCGQAILEEAAGALEEFTGAHRCRSG